MDRAPKFSHSATRDRRPLGRPFSFWSFLEPAFLFFREKLPPAHRATAIRKNDQGFTLLIAVFMLALFASVTTYFSIWSRVSQIRDRGIKTCIEFGWSFQKEQAKFLTQLLKLNPQAGRLQKKWRLAQKSLKAAVSTGNAGAIAAARLYLMKVQIERGILDQRQKTLLSKSAHTASRFRIGVKREKSFQYAQVKVPIGLHVTALPPQGLAPLYVTGPGFTGRQAVTIFWQLNPSREAGPLFLELARSQSDGAQLLDKKINLACSVSLTERMKSWRPQIQAVRLSSKH